MKFREIMKKPVLIYIVFLPIMNGCTSSNWTHQGKLAKSELLSANSFHEECAHLRPDQILDYSFETSGPVQFNIHYHDEKKVEYPVSEEDISALQGTFIPRTKENYCLMWSNPLPESVGLTYELTLEVLEK